MSKLPFSDFQKAVSENFDEMCKGGSLFRVNLDRDELFEVYMNAFPDGTNEIFRTRREYDCNCCKNFIRGVGGVIQVKDGNIRSIWDISLGDDVFQVVADALSKYVRTKPIRDVFKTYEGSYGKIKSYSMNDLTNQTEEFNHFHVDVPSAYKSRPGRLDRDIADVRDSRNVFFRALSEFSLDALMTVKELIDSNTLYKGQENKSVVDKLIKYKKEFDKLATDEEKDLFAWEKSLNESMAVTRIRNHSIGTLITDISNGVDLDKAVRSYEVIVAPSNYKRPKPIFTQKMLEDAQKKVQEMGYEESLARRFANLDDITVNNIIFVNRDASKRVQGASGLFAELEKDVKRKARTFSGVDKIGIEDFIKNVVPNAQSIEAYMESRHLRSLVSLIAPVNKDSKTMFKWNNGFSWAYSGNMTDSDIKENVKNAGGDVTGVLRFSIQWNDMGDHDKNDLDAHCQEPDGGDHIMYDHKRSYKTGGNLDIDITHPKAGIPAVENITYPSKGKMIDGEYKFFVRQFANRGGRNGFRAEIEFDGQVYQYDYNKELMQDEDVYVATVTLKDGVFSIKEELDSSAMSREFWGVKTNSFIPVSVMMLSPNYWDEQSGIGHKHYFFMLDGCKNDELPNGWYNEFLNGELHDYRKVFEALGSKAHVEETENQLSGLGFSSTRRNTLIVKVKGSSERVMEIQF